MRHNEPAGSESAEIPAGPAQPAMRPPRSPLRIRNYALLWSGGLISDLGDWTLLIALPVFVFQFTGSALTTSTVFVAELVPALIVGQLAGVMVDRWDRRRILIATGVIQAGLLLPLLAVSTTDRLWIVYLVAALQSCLARLASPAKAALIPSLVPREQLTAANSLNAVSDNLARLVGSPLGGLAIQLLGLVGVVVVDATTFLVSALLTAQIRVARAAAAASAAAREASATEPATGIEPHPAPEPVVIEAPAAEAATPAPPVGASLVADWIDGLRTIRRTPPLPAILSIGALSQLSQGIFVVLFVVFVLRELHGTGGDVGLIRGMQAIGGVIGGIVVGWLGRRLGPNGLISWGFVVFGLIALATWNAPHITTAIWLYVGLFIAAGIPGVATSTGLITIVQTVTPPTHLGRVFAAFETGAGALQAVGVLAAGALADRLGVVPILNVQAGIYILCGVLAFVALRSRINSHDRHGDIKTA
jgi:MFS family permease